MTIPSFNLPSLSYSLPIIIRDRYRVNDLIEIQSSMEEGSLKYYELEEYLKLLTSTSKELLSNISNNLERHKIREAASAITEEMVDKMILLAPATGRYNCHGWSFGIVSDPDFYPKKGKFLEDAALYKKQEAAKMYIDPTMCTFFGLEGSQLIENTIPSKEEGNIVIYSDKDKTITHTARYIKNLNWYSYEDELYSEWYNKHREGVIFDDFGKNCTIESYTSKLGLGHLIAHNLEDIVPLYGDIDGFFDLVVPS